MKMTGSTIYEPTVERHTRKIAIRDVDYAVNEWGDPSAPRFFYLHGWGDSGSTFQFVVDQLAADWFVVAPDWRGFGRSTFHAPSYWFPDYMADLHQLLEHYQSGEAVRLVGHSMGANIGSLYAGTMPERVAAFINIEGFGLPETGPADAPRRYRRWLEEGSVEQSYSEYSGFADLAAKVIKRSPGMSEEAAQFVVREWAYMDDNGIVRARADPNHKLPNAVLYRRAEAEACWQQITARILLVSGGESRFAEQFGLTSTLPFPNAETVAINGSGHMIHFEQPAKLAREIERFFTQYL